MLRALPVNPSRQLAGARQFFHRESQFVVFLTVAVAVAVVARSYLFNGEIAVAVAVNSCRCRCREILPLPLPRVVGFSWRSERRKRRHQMRARACRRDAAKSIFFAHAARA